MRGKILRLAETVWHRLIGQRTRAVGGYQNSLANSIAARYRSRVAAVAAGSRGVWRRNGFAFALTLLQQGTAAAVVLLLIGFGHIWLDRDSLLQHLADLWIISDPITRADDVVVLGGGLKYRPPIAAELYKKGLVSKILVSQTRERNEKVLLTLGVPAAAIEMFGTDNRSTADEARAVKHWAEHNSGSVLIIPADIFAARRVRWIFRRELHATGVRVEVPSFEEDIKRAGWWKTSAGRMTFRDEVLKYIYYRLKYRNHEPFTRNRSTIEHYR